ncbi:hypothetical protein DF268_11655 [Streptomyces sp. V2]|nr:hypothetical protein DF268_11655 [Streptomyces sp. V2]
MTGARIPTPPVGVSSPHSMYAANVPLKLNILGTLSLDFKGGINLTPRTATEDGAAFEVEGFRMEADTSPSTPDSGAIISLTPSNRTLTPLSVLRPSSNGGSEMLIYLNLTVEVIDKATGETTLTLHTDPTKYVTLRAADIKSFPLINQHFSLQEPVSFFEEGGSESRGTLDAFEAISNTSA